MKHIGPRLIHVLALSALIPLLSIEARADVVDVDSAVAHIGVGAGISFNRPVSNDGNSAEGVAFVYRWHSFHSGWGPTFGIDWHSTDFNRTMGAVSAPFGTLGTRAVLGGYGHTQRFGHRFSASASASAGYSFNNFSLSTQAGPAFRNAGVSLVGAGIDNSWVLRPDVGVWYDVFRHVGVGVSAAYLWSRPKETLTTATGVHVDHLQADTWELTTGITVGVWRKRRD